MKQLISRLTKSFRNFDYAHGYMEEFLATKIAAQIEKMRKDRGWSQRELAERAGVRQPRISLLESGDYEGWSFQTLISLAEAFDVGVTVSFTEFSDVIREISAFSPELLSVESRERDLDISERRLLRQSSAQNVTSHFEPSGEEPGEDIIYHLEFRGTHHDTA